MTRVLVIAVIALAVAEAVPVHAATDASPVAALERDVAGQINAIRRRQQMPALVVSRELADVARTSWAPAFTETGVGVCRRDRAYYFTQIFLGLAGTSPGRR